MCYLDMSRITDDETHRSGGRVELYKIEAQRQGWVGVSVLFRVIYTDLNSNVECVREIE